jgi:serine/threonine-protein kinase RsbW
VKLDRWSDRNGKGGHATFWNVVLLRAGRLGTVMFRMNGASWAPSAEATSGAVNTFTPTLSSGRSARSWLAPLLEAWAVNGAAYDVSLVVSELVTNAAVHGCGTVHVRVQRLQDAVRIEVSDEGPGRIVVQEPEPEALGGRGLLVVDHMTRCWGVLGRVPSGKTVWAEVPVF